MSTDTATLHDLVGPAAAETLLAAFDGAPCHVRASAADRFAEILSVRDVEHLVATATGAAEGWVGIVQRIVRRPPPSMQAADGGLSMRAVYEAFQQGASILLTRVHRRWPPVRALCTGLERDLTGRGIRLAKRLGANAYLSPPRGEGLAPHRDDHDVLVFQIAGVKEWSVGAPADGPAAITLEPGDVLYLRRGTEHHARARGDGPSLHLTIGITPVVLGDVLSRLVAELEEVDATVRDETPAALGERIAKAIEAHATPSTIERLLSDLDRAFVGSLSLPPASAGGGFAPPPSITRDTRVRRRLDVTCHVSRDGDEVVVTLPGDVSLRVASGALAAVLAALSSDGFRVCDLPGLAGAAQVELTEALVREGALDVVGDREDDG